MAKKTQTQKEPRYKVHRFSPIHEKIEYTDPLEVDAYRFSPWDKETRDYLERDPIFPKPVDSSVGKLNAYNEQPYEGEYFEPKKIDVEPNARAYESQLPADESEGLGMSDAEIGDLLAQAIIQLGPAVIGYGFNKNEGIYAGTEAGKEGMKVYDKLKDARKAKADKYEEEQRKQKQILERMQYQKYGDLTPDQIKLKEQTEQDMRARKLQIQEKGLTIQEKRLLIELEKIKNLDPETEKLKNELKKKELEYKGKKLGYDESKLEMEKRGELPEQKDKKRKAEMDLRKEISGNKVIQEAVSVGAAYDKIVRADPKTGAGQMSIIIGYMKMLDPGSVVREGEFDLAAKSGGYLGYLANMGDKISKGQVANIDAINALRTEAQKIYQSQRNIVDPMYERYRNIANKDGLDIQNVIFDPFGAIDASVDVANKPIADVKIPPKIPVVDGEEITKDKIIKTKDPKTLKKFIDGIKKEIQQMGQ